MLRRVSESTKAHTTTSNALLLTNASKSYRNTHASIFFVGQNGSWDNNPEKLVAQYKRMIEFSGTSNYVVIGLHSGTSTSRAALESAMLAAFGNRYIKWREYCCTRALSDAEITPTEADLSAMEIGSCPPSLLSDAVHLNLNGRTLLAKIIYNRFVTLGVF